MAKLTTEAVQRMGYQAAAADAAVQAVTLAELEGIDYNSRARRAVAMAAGALAVARQQSLNFDERRERQFLDAFVGRAREIWAGKERQHEVAQKAWRKACGGMRLDAATAKIVELVNSFQIRGMRPLLANYGLTVHVERDWAVEADVHFSFERDHAARVENPDDPQQRAGYYTLKLTVSWSGTNCSLAQGTASVALYRELLDMMAEVESVANRMQVVWTFGVDETADAAAAD